MPLQKTNAGSPFHQKDFKSNFIYFIPIITTKFAYYAAFRGCSLIRYLFYDVVISFLYPIEAATLKMFLKPFEAFLLKMGK